VVGAWSDQHGRCRWSKIGYAKAMTLGEALGLATTAIDTATEAESAPKGVRTFHEAATA
jgi:hypothetical protein